MATANVEQGRLIAAVRQTAEQVENFQARAVAIYNVPAERVDSEQARTIAIFPRVAQSVQVAQARAIAIVRGRTANPRIQVWTSQLDTHEKYYLRLGDGATLVYDTYSQEWMEYGHNNLPFWRVSCGTNWQAANRIATFYGSNIVIGDDVTGMLYFLDPRQPYDDPPLMEMEGPRYFTRKVYGQLALRGREIVPCYAVWLTTDMGQPAYDGAAVKLEISDDAAATFFDAGSIPVHQGVVYPELSWYSLGQIAAPGRIFNFSDDGAITRIDTMEMQDPPSSEDDDKK